MKKDLEKCFGFILELEKLKAIQRKTKPVGLERYENSAEHSWQITVLAMVLANFSNEEVNIDRVIKMLLIHDIGEIDADDVFFFDEAAKAGAKDAEYASVKRILGMLPEKTGDELLELWEEFEYGDSKEAKFARSIDRVMPILQNLNNNKQSWNENGVGKEEILTKTSYMADGSNVLWESIRERIEIAFE